MTTFSLAISYEYESKAPLTWRGTVNATTPATALHRGEREARKTLKPGSWASMVAVVTRNDA